MPSPTQGVVSPGHDARLLILMPTHKDAERTQQMLAESGHVCAICGNLQELCREVDAGAGALLLADEFLRATGYRDLTECLRRQPAWSSIPVIVLTRDVHDSQTRDALHGNITLVERPVRFRSLTSVVDASLRTRQQQYQIRDLLARHERQADELRESEARYRTLVEQVRDHAIFRTDVDGVATSWNAGVGRVLGFEEAEFVGVDIKSTIFTAEDLQAGIPQQELAEAAATGVASNDRWMRRRDGSRFFAMGSTTALRDGAGALIGFSKVMRDATDWKTTADALRQADRQKDEFLAMLAHELRNPLSPIRSGLDLLRMKANTPDETLELMQHQVEHLVRLVDDLLDVSRIVQQKIELRLETVELAGIVHRSVESVLPSFKQQNHDVRISLPAEPIWLRADAIRLTQVIENLLHNAAKYTPPRGRITITAACQAGEAVLEVRDNGIGIESDLLPRIFELFTQASRSLDRSQGGLGIGLTLVRTLVQMHGGTISAESEGTGLGSAFTIRLPLSAEPRQSATPGAPPEPQRSLRILAVDDNIGAATLLSRLLTQFGNHQVAVAHDGRAALQKAAEFRPEVMLLDIGLPGMDGYQVARTLRHNREFDEMFLVALTGYGQDEDRRKAEAAGFDLHLTKPPSVQSLKDALNHPKVAR